MNGPVRRPTRHGSIISFHVFIEEINHFFRMISQIVVTVETTLGAFDPEQLFVFGTQKIESSLSIARIVGPGVVFDLGHEHGDLYRRREALRIHIAVLEATQLHLFAVDQVHVFAHTLQFGER